MAQSWLTATSASWVQAILLPQPPEQLGLQLETFKLLLLHLKGILEEKVTLNQCYFPWKAWLIQKYN